MSDILKKITVNKDTVTIDRAALEDFLYELVLLNWCSNYPVMITASDILTMIEDN